MANWAAWIAKGYLAATSTSKWLRIEIGDHLALFYSDQALALQKRFFDHFLKGDDNGWEKEPQVKVEVRRPDGAAWRAASAWPLPGTRWQRWYLDDANGTMSPALHAALPADQSYPGLSEGLTSTPFAVESEFPGRSTWSSPIRRAS